MSKILTWTGLAVTTGGLLAIALATYLTAPAAGANADTSKQVSGHEGARTPVLVELFTSEGCSSCPPADALLARLKKDQPVSGAQIVALSEHVDYWNNLGWRDPFSSAAFSARQRDYGQAFRLDSVYTPQMVVDGQTEFVGSDDAHAESAIARAARSPRVGIQIERDATATTGSGGIDLNVRVDRLPTLRSGEAADVLLAITEDNLRSNVLRGENTGRRLAHVAVVRRLTRIGSATGQKPFVGKALVVLDSGWKHDDLQAVVFVQDPGTYRILGVSALRL